MSLSPEALVPFLSLEARDATTGFINVIVDSLRGSRCKFRYDEKANIFRLSKLLPLGATFPYPFGFVPSTLGEDGDPLDVLVLLEEDVFVGAVLPVRVLGVLQAEQTEEGHKVRNDRLIGMVETPSNPAEFRALDELSKQQMEEIEHFFISYNQMAGRRFQPCGRHGPRRAEQLIEKGIRHHVAAKRKNG